MFLVCYRVFPTFLFTLPLDTTVLLAVLLLPITETRTELACLQQTPCEGLPTYEQR